MSKRIKKNEEALQENISNENKVTKKFLEIADTLIIVLKQYLECGQIPSEILGYCLRLK